MSHQPAEGGPVPAGVARSVPHLVFDRNYGLYFFGKVFSMVGIWLANVVSAMLMWDLTRSAVMVGAVSVVQFVPQVVLSPWTGALSDRFNRRTILMTSKVFTGGSVGVLGLVIVRNGIDELGRGAPVLVTALILGIGLAVGNPALQSLTPSLVPRADLGTAIALTSTTASIARAAGPALGALLYALEGPGVAYLVSGALQMTFVAFLQFVHVVKQPASKNRSIFAGFAYVMQTRKMLRLLIGVGAVGITVDPVLTLSPPLVESLGGPDALVGALASAFGVGAFFSITVFGHIERRFGISTVGLIGFLLIAAGNFIVSPALSAESSLAGMFMAGVGFHMATSSLTTRVQAMVPEDLRGRVMALWGVAFLGTRPIGAAVNGLIADYLSLHLAFVVMAVLALAAGFGLRSSERAAEH